jgi:hypothetical protein
MFENQGSVLLILSQDVLETAALNLLLQEPQPRTESTLLDARAPASGAH